jgi:hypothetical protein
MLQTGVGTLGGHRDICRDGDIVLVLVIEAEDLGLTVSKGRSS